MKIILQITTQEQSAPLVVMLQPQTSKTRRPVKMIDRDGIPAEMAYAAVCREAGCECNRTFGNN
jgi:hypothetical protein